MFFYYLNSLLFNFISTGLKAVFLKVKVSEHAFSAVGGVQSKQDYWKWQNNSSNETLQLPGVRNNHVAVRGIL